MKKYLILTIIAIFLIPLSSMIPLRGQPVWYPQYLGMLFMMFLSSSLFIWKFNRWLSLLTIICLFSTFFITRLSPRAIMLLVQLNFACLMSYGVSRFDQKQRRKILYAIIGFMLLQGIWLLLQSLNLDPIFSSISDKNRDALVAFSGSKDQLGTYFALILPVIIYLIPQLFFIPLAGIMVSKSSFALFAAIMAMIIYYWLVNKDVLIKIIVPILIIGSIFFMFVEKLKIDDFTTRFGVWREAVTSTVRGKVYVETMTGNKEVYTKPIWGYGFGSFQRVFPYIPEEYTKHTFNFSNEKFNHAHNDPIELFFELGWSGLVILTGLVSSFIYGFIKTVRDKELTLYFSCLMAYLFNSMGNFISQIAISGMFLILFYGMYRGRKRELDGAIASVG